MEIDVKKIFKTCKDVYELTGHAIKIEQELLDAIHIMDSALENNTEDCKEMHEKRMKEFIEKYKKPC